MVDEKEKAEAMEKITGEQRQAKPKKDTEEHSLAHDIIKFMKWVIIAMAIGWLLTIAGFLWYLSQYDYISYQQDGEGYNNINTHVQGSVHNNNGTEATSTQEENPSQESGS